MMKIKLYEEKYRDDMIFMVLQAKDALGRIPRINGDLLDIRTKYFDRGDMFWIAVDDTDRVIGCGGFSRIEGTNEAFVHRLYVKASEKRKGIGIENVRARLQSMQNAKLEILRGDHGTTARILIDEEGGAQQ